MEKVFTIIEDCAPYYVRFTHPNIEQLIEVSKCAVSDIPFIKPFTNSIINRENIIDIQKLCPLFDLFDIAQERISMFVSQPGLYYRAHKDGLYHKFSLNYTVKVLDDKCVTSWYSDKDLAEYKIDNLVNKTSRECTGFDKTKHTPLKSMTAKPNECILFNTDIFHDWDNTASNNERMILTLRLKNYSKPGSTFEDARQLIFQMRD
jgi:hypothetical protein